MHRRSLLPLLFAAGSIAVSSCGQSSVPTTSTANTNTASTSQRVAGSKNLSSTAFDNAVRPQGCYVTNGTAYTASATVTFYGWPDNSPPGAAIAHPVIHQVASGDGSYCNPTTFATEPTQAENQKIPYGTKIYVPLVQKYFLREDDCTTSGPQGLGCKGLWFDLWIGGDANSNSNAVINCENNLTPNGPVNVVVNPPANEPVQWVGPIYTDQGGCNTGGSPPPPTPSPTPSATPKPTPTPTGTPKPTPTPTGHPTPTPTATPTGHPTPTPTPTPGGGVSSTVVFYGYPDNGNSCAIAHPVIHSCAGGSGTYSDPITFASSTSNNSMFPYGAKIYVPFMLRYFIREDDCGSGACTGPYDVNLWVGGNSSDVPGDIIRCEASLTPSGPVNIILNPPSNEPVTNLGPIWNESNGMCNGSYNYSKVRH